MSTFEEKISNIVEKAINDQVFPCLEILVAKNNQILLHEVYGSKTPGSKVDLLKKNSLFDLASLTKPLATALAVIQLNETGAINLDDSIIKYLPELQQKNIQQVTIKHLLLHTSGLPDWVALYEPKFDRTSGWNRLCQIPLKNPPGHKMVYSCLGFIILAEMVRRVSGQSLNEFCRSYFYLPLGLTNLQFNPNTKNNSIEVVPTGYCPLRKVELKGIVHDENSALFDGEGGNSGLFGTAEEIYRLCQVFLNKNKKTIQLLSPKSFEALISNWNPAPLEPRALGWDYKFGKADYWSCSDLMPEGSIGHLGFTGTSLWLDPKSGLIIILLSNRVLISRETNIPLMREFRPKMHALLISEYL